MNLHSLVYFIQVLKALALLRLGRHDAGVTLLEEVHDQHPTDDNTLQAMGICYRETNRSRIKMTLTI